MAKLQQIKINGTILDNAYIKNRYVDETFSETVNTFEIVLPPSAKTALGFELQNYMTVEIWEGDITATDKQIMDGYMNEISDKPEQITIKGGDQLLKMTFEQINKVYIADTDPTAGIVSEIIKDLLDYCGLDYDSTTIQDTTSMEGGRVAEFVCKDTDPLERAMALADNVGFMLYYRNDTKKVYFHDKATMTNPNTIYIGGVNNNVQNPPEWTFDGKDMFNFLKIEGVLDIYQQPDQTFSGDSLNKSFALAGKNAEFVKVTVNGTTMTGGKSGGSSSYDYTFNKESNTIVFISAPGTGTDNIIVTPFVGEPTPVEIEDAASIAKYKQTIKKKLTLTDVKNVIDAESKGQKLLNAFKEEFTSATVKMLPSVISSLGIEAGQTINLSDARNTKIGDRTTFIRRVRRFYPETEMEVELGDRDWKILDSQYDHLIRLKRLEEQMSGNQDVVTIVKKPSMTISTSVSNVEITADYICDSPHTNHPINGYSNKGRILDSFEEDIITDWTSPDFILSSNITNPVHLSRMLKAEWTTPKTGYIESTQALGDLSSYTGATSGIPDQGCMGLWIQLNNATDVSEVRLRIGSNSTNYKEYTAKSYNSNEDYEYSLLNYLPIVGNNYLTFRLDSPTGSAGSINWTNINYVRITIVTTSTSHASFDLLSISDSNYVGACPTVSSTFKRTMNLATISF